MASYNSLSFDQKQAYNETVSRLSQAGIYVYLSGVVLETVDGAIMSTMPALVAAIQAGKTPDTIVSAFTAYAAANGGPYLAFAASHDGGGAVWQALNTGGQPGRVIPTPKPGNPDPASLSFDLATVVQRIPQGITYRGNYAYTVPQDLQDRLNRTAELLAQAPKDRGRFANIEDNMLSYGLAMALPGFELKPNPFAASVDPQTFVGTTLATWLAQQRQLGEPSGNT